MLVAPLASSTLGTPATSDTLATRTPPPLDDAANHTSSPSEAATAGTSSSNAGTTVTGAPHAVALPLRLHVRSTYTPRLRPKANTADLVTAMVVGSGSGASGAIPPTRPFGLESTTAAGGSSGGAGIVVPGSALGAEGSMSVLVTLTVLSPLLGSTGSALGTQATRPRTAHALRMHPY